MSDGAQDRTADAPGRDAAPGDPIERLFKHLLKFRYLAAIVVVLSMVHALTFLFLGVHSAVVTYWHVLVGGGAAQRPGLELLHSLDFFLVSLVLIILALGVAKLFLLPDSEVGQRHLPSWLKIESFSDLK